MSNYIEIRNANITFGKYQALKNVDFDLELGEVHCLAGTNGSGKSTLVKIISGVYQPDSFDTKIKINGYSYENLTPFEAIENGICVIFQDLSLFSNLTVRENIAFHQHLKSPFKLVSKEKQIQISKSVLNDLGVEIDLEQIVGSLSVAYQQVIAIARALAVNAKVIFMDEPTASLSRKEVDNLLRIVKKLKENKIAVVFISHKLNEVLSVSDKVTVIRDSLKVGTFSTEGMNDLKLSKLMTNQSYSYVKRTPHHMDDKSNVLEIKNLSKHKEYNDVSLTIKKGEVLGIGGLMGAGKTELALSLFGLNKPDSGVILLNNKEVSFKNNIQAIKEGVAYVSEDRLNKGAILEQSVMDNVSLPLLKNLTNKFKFINVNKQNEIVQQYCDHMTVKSASLDIPIGNLSGGNQQKAVLAKWLACKPTLLILDNPSIGVDIEAKVTIYKEIDELAKTGVSILLISDEVEELYYNSDRILVLKNGSLKHEFDGETCALNKVMEIINE